MKGKHLVLFLLCWSLHLQGFAQHVPEKLEYCGIYLDFTQKAREKINEYINRIYESPRYYNQMVDRARLYMPYIKQAFQRKGIPLDIRFLAIMESGMLPDAVSSSNKVGFWQLDENTALKGGLVVNNVVDERRHISRSSHLAASILANANKDFDNWLYAVIAYNEGLLNAAPHTDPRYFGSKEMVITDKAHWYVLKAIAHKIAYEPALDMMVTPDVWLTAERNDGKFSVRKICQKNEVNPEEFIKYNQWILDIKQAPKVGNFIYYLPKSGKDVTLDLGESNVEATYDKLPNDIALPEDNPIQQEQVYTSTQADAVSQEANTPVKTSVDPVESQTSSSYYYPNASNISSLPQSQYVVFPLKFDLNYGSDFYLVDGRMRIIQIAERFGVPLVDLLNWNHLGPNETPKLGSILRIVKPSKANFHIVEEGDNLADIAVIYGKTVSYIQQRNRMEANEAQIYIGQKLYLKKIKPKGEKIILLESNLTPISQQSVVEETIPTEKAIPVIEEHAPQQEVIEEEDPIVESAIEEKESATKTKPSIYSNGYKKWVDHQVQAGENLSQIAQLYNVSVEVIKGINKIESIHVGQVLRILSKVD